MNFDKFMACFLKDSQEKGQDLLLGIGQLIDSYSTIAFEHTEDDWTRNFSFKSSNTLDDYRKCRRTLANLTGINLAHRSKYHVYRPWWSCLKLSLQPSTRYLSYVYSSKCLCCDDILGHPLASLQFKWQGFYYYKLHRQEDYHLN